MALQLLYSSWQEEQSENTICASSQDLLEQDIHFILHQAETRIDYSLLPEDEENSNLSGTLYLHLPSGRYAIVHTSFYSVENSKQEKNVIIHAFVTEEDETPSPMLYAINNCFKLALTEEEQQYYLSNTTLPRVPFPRAQFKLNQKEIRKFFSPGRRKTLSCVLQAAIDSYENERIILLNDNYSSLKYWFYGLHCCLPEIIKKSMTYSTYTFSRMDNCKLICGAPENRINSDAEIEAGNFVIDNMGGATCEDIESAKYARFIAQKFYENAGEVLPIADGINNIMNTYHLPLSVAVGILKLMEYDFEWFDSGYDLQYFMGKIASISKLHLENVAKKFWMAFQTPDFKFKPNESILPLLAYIFKCTDRQTKKEIIDYIYDNQFSFSIYEAGSLKQYYSDVTNKIGFVYEYLPYVILETDSLEKFYESVDHNLWKISTLLYTIVDKYDAYVKVHGCEKVEKLCLSIYTLLLETHATEMILEFCQRTEDLPEEFIRRVIVNGMWKYVEHIDEAGEETNLIFDEELVFSVIEELITRTTSAAELLKIFARKGRYSNSVLKFYHRLCNNYPEETAQIDEKLWKKDIFSAFLSDMSMQHFVEKEHATLEELTSFFHQYYLTGKDKDQIFESKVETYLRALLPVRQIEKADYFLRLICSHFAPSDAKKRCDYLIPFLCEQSVDDLFDYYSNAPKEKPSILSVLRDLGEEISPKLYTVFLAVDLLEASQTPDQSLTRALLESILSPIHKVLILPDEKKYGYFMSRFYHIMLICMMNYAKICRDTTILYSNILVFFSDRSDFLLAFIDITKKYSSNDPSTARDLCPIFLPILLTENQTKLRMLLLSRLTSLSPTIKKDIFPYLVELSPPEKKDALTEILSHLYGKGKKSFARLVAKSQKIL